MNREELLPGRRLDALVAKCLGWIGVAERRRVGQGLSENVVLLGLRSETADSLTEIPYFSIRIEDAWQAWDAIAQPDWIIRCGEKGSYSIYEDWRSFEDGISIADGETFMLTICRAVARRTP